MFAFIVCLIIVVLVFICILCMIYKCAVSTESKPVKRPKWVIPTICIGAACILVVILLNTFSNPEVPASEDEIVVAETDTRSTLTDKEEQMMHQYCTDMQNTYGLEYESFYVTDYSNGGIIITVLFDNPVYKGEVEQSPSGDWTGRLKKLVYEEETLEE